MKKFILLFLFSIPFLIHAQIDIDYGMPKKYTLTAINITGNGNIDKKLVILYTGLIVGSEIFIPGDDITRAIINLWKQKIFSDIKILIDKVEGDKVELGLYLMTRPSLSRYSITGIGKNESDKIREKISLTQNDIISDQLINNVTAEITDFYREKGFYNPRIKISQKPDSLFGKNYLSLKIEISKGKKVRIRELVITGNENVKTRKIKRLLKKTKKYSIITFFRSSKFVSGLFEEDKERVIAHYNGMGYRDAKIVKDSVSAIGKNSLKVTIQIYEGRKYYFRNITWTGNTKYETK